MTKLCLRPEDAAPILGKSPSNIRRDMRRGVLDLGPGNPAGEVR